MWGLKPAGQRRGIDQSLRRQIQAMRSRAGYWIVAFALISQILLPIFHGVPPAQAAVPRDVAALAAVLGQDVPLCLHVASDGSSDRDDQAPGPWHHHHDDCPYCQSASHLTGVLPVGIVVVARLSKLGTFITQRPNTDFVPVPVRIAARPRAPPTLI